MKNNRLLIKILTFLILGMGSTLAHAKAIFSIILTTSPATQLVDRFVDGIITYSVTNNTNKTRSLVMIPILGVNQIDTQAGDCPTIMVLSPNESCTLRLQATFDEMTQLNLQRIEVIPEICKTTGPGQSQPDYLLCSKSCQQSIFLKVSID